MRHNLIVCFYINWAKSTSFLLNLSQVSEWFVSPGISVAGLNEIIICQHWTEKNPCWRNQIEVLYLALWHIKSTLQLLCNFRQESVWGMYFSVSAVAAILFGADCDIGTWYLFFRRVGPVSLILTKIIIKRWCFHHHTLLFTISE